MRDRAMARGAVASVLATTTVQTRDSLTLFGVSEIAPITIIGSGYHAAFLAIAAAMVASAAYLRITLR